MIATEILFFACIIGGTMALITILANKQAIG